ncbi:hypothetical protein KGA66_25325 [Actinocrinis puniceicyclus]|uniref:Uncharacterized protein n=1 Tax=Actinocrinis puniceicyclus TaxID=977794 RepID=A0A8J7WQ05_9ACTN|nr:hypothetical protein [Actinocrinis puniceicyclus]MBS2966388.1 hypothetical protein [Actinocrinis puniceicyclus]
MKDLDVLLAELNDSPADAAVDRAAEALAEASEAAAALAERDGYDTVTLWWAASALAKAYSALQAHTTADPPDLPSGPSTLADDPDRLIELVHASARALDRAARAATEPGRIYALTHASNLARQAERACSNARAAA